MKKNSIKVFKIFLASLLFLLFIHQNNLTPYGVNAEETQNNVITFPDPNLERCIRKEINKSKGDIDESDVKNITDISIEYIKDLEGIQYLTNLTKLSLMKSEITDISPLKNLSNLNRLWIYNTLISDISPLKNLTNLEDLKLDRNKITDISPLRSLTNLETLQLNNNKISDVSPLKSLTNLKNLHLDHNQITDISPLQNLANLEALWLIYNEINDISDLKSLTNLSALLIEHNQISDISALQNLVNLNYLQISHNQIHDIGPLVNNVQNDGFGPDYSGCGNPFSSKIFIENNYLDVKKESKDYKDIQTLINAKISVFYKSQRVLKEFKADNIDFEISTPEYIFKNYEPAVHRYMPEVSLKVNNNSSKDQLVTVIIGCFDENNSLKWAPRIQENIKAGTSTELKYDNISLVQYMNDICTLRVFVWDTLDKMNQFTDVINIPVIMD